MYRNLEIFLPLFLNSDRLKNPNNLFISTLLIILFGEISSVRKKGLELLLAQSALLQQWQMKEF
jgi:hypothetical protein